MQKDKKHQTFINITKKVYDFLPEIISVILLIILIRTLICQLSGSKGNIDILQNSMTELIAFSGFLGGLIIAYLSSKVLQIRQEKLEELPKFNEYTQKLHKVRTIIDRLLNSRIIEQTAKSHVDNKYKELTYFDIRASTYVENNLTKEKEALLNNFGKDKDVGRVAYLYLGLKSFIIKKGIDYTLYAEFDVHWYYKKKYIEDLQRYDSGNIFWFYLEHKYHDCQSKLDFNNITEQDKQTILETIIKIDKERYKDLDLGPKLLVKLGQQLTDDILPNLNIVQTKIEEGLPKIVNSLFAISGMLIFFGFILPIISKMFCFHYITDIISVSFTLSISFYLLISFRRFMKKEIKIL